MQQIAHCRFFFVISRRTGSLYYEYNTRLRGYVMAFENGDDAFAWFSFQWLLRLKLFNLLNRCLSLLRNSEIFVFGSACVSAGRDNYYTMENSSKHLINKEEGKAQVEEIEP